MASRTSAPATANSRWRTRAFGPGASKRTLEVSSSRRVGRAVRRHSEGRVWVNPVGGPSIAVQPPSTDKELPVT